jgi:two-component system response regulator RegX3
MKRQLRILVVEDEEAIRSGLIDVFLYHGYELDSSDNGPDGLKKALAGKFDLVLLDVMLPGMNGFDICNEIRKHDRDLAIIMLTAKNSDEEIIRGLKLGADDYVAKPFSIAQLVMRAEAVLRRSRVSLEQASTIELCGDIRIDTENLCGVSGSEQLTFTRREIEILKYLALHSSRPVSREELLTGVWGYARDLALETRTVDIHIAKLRRKIETNPKHPVNLLTIRGAGYRLMTKG